MNIELSQISFEHFSAYRNMRLAAETWFQEACKDVSQIEPSCLTAWTLLLNKGIEGERTSCGLVYADVNTAIKFLNGLGYEVIEKDNSN